MANNWNVGDPCRVIYTEDGKAYDAVIEDLNNEESFAVVYFVSWPESKQTVLLPDLMPREPEVEGPQWKVGDQCRAIFVDDGLYYDVTILSMEATEAGEKYAKVNYNGYDSEALIYLANLRLSNDPSTYPAGTSSEVTATSSSVQDLKATGEVRSPRKAVAVIPKLETLTEIPAEAEEDSPWKVGDRCRGMSKDDDKYYNCTILSFIDANYAKVLFEAKNIEASILLTDLKSIDDASTYLCSDLKLEHVVPPAKDEKAVAAVDPQRQGKAISEVGAREIGEVDSNASTVVVNPDSSILSSIGSEKSATVKVWKEGDLCRARDEKSGIVSDYRIKSIKLHEGVDKYAWLEVVGDESKEVISAWLDELQECRDKSHLTFLS